MFNRYLSESFSLIILFDIYTMSTLEGGKQIINKNILFYFDAANARSYPGTGSVGYELSTGSSVPGSSISLLPGITWSSSNYGVMSFNGARANQNVVYSVDSWISCGNRISKLGLTFPFTLEAWVNPKKLFGANTAGYSYGVFALDSMEQFPGNYYGVNIMLSQNYGNDRHYLQGGYYSGTGYGGGDRRTASTTSDVVVCGEWTYIVCVISGLNNIKLYANGVLVSSGISGSAPGLAWSNGAGKTVIGKTPGYYKYTFNGDIAMVRAYNSILSDADIIQNYNLHSLRFGLGNI